MGDPSSSFFCRERVEGSSLLGFPHPAGGNQGMGIPQSSIVFLGAAPQDDVGSCTGGCDQPRGCHA